MAHGAQEPEPLPPSLHDTGLYAEPSGLQVRPQNRGFTPQYPLWSDGATKHRWVALPAGQAIDASQAAVWDFPRGTKLWKEFSVDGRREILPPMPIPMYKNLTDADIEAIFTYLQSIPAVKNHVPEPLPPPEAPATK